MGRVQANNIDDLARLADEYGSRELRLTVEKNIISTTSIQFYGQDKSSSLKITEEVQKHASLMRLDEYSWNWNTDTPKLAISESTSKAREMETTTIYFKM
ncbi:hypothetical protein MTR67_008879 [Solanum verrucosum]|uniref:Nitrite/Sulfite reductase ferredoxin-like domain-containing protein n=1 Tax=Solanum verrucosum TaxID=315347 RepID=A0AAF0Q282_SOLVR|nr:hypothetical protein MTR67_008879 [Solanum verrucosum]